MEISTHVYFGILQDPSELLGNGDFESVSGDDFDDWTETDQAGSEKLSNGNFESVTGDDFDNWTELIVGSGNIEDETTIVHGGSHSAKVTTGASYPGDYAELQQVFTPTAGKAYRLTVWVKGDYQIFLGVFGSEPASDAYASGSAADWTQVELFWDYPSALSGSKGVALTSSDTNGVAYFDDVSIVEEYTSVEDEGTTVHGDDHAVKMIGGGTAQSSIEVTEDCDAQLDSELSFWSIGDGENGIHYEIYDESNSAMIKSGYGTIQDEWTKTLVSFTTPSGCESITITFESNGIGPFYLDDVSVLQYGGIEYVESDDVLASPAPSYGHGISYEGPFNGVADTGVAMLYIDNRDSNYSPGSGSRIPGFEEGMPVKITIAADTEIDDDTNLLLNSSFEDLA